MRKTITLLLLFVATLVKSQDTLFIKTSKSAVPCVITKIIPNKIFYTEKNQSKEIDMSRVSKYSIGKVQFSNGLVIRDFDGRIYSASIANGQCSAILSNGKRCKSTPVKSSGKCERH